MAEIKINRKLQSSFPTHQRKSVPDEALSQALSLYEQGLYKDSFLSLEAVGPMQSWKGAGALTFGFRLANNLGASRLGALLMKRAFREEPTHEQAVVHYGYHLKDKKGPLPAWKHATKSEEIPNLPPETKADLLTQRAVIAAEYRDFDTAWKLWDTAAEMAPQSRWIATEKAALLLSQEKRSEALEVIQDVLIQSPWYRPAVQHKARLLHLLGQTDEAIHFLTQSLEHIQSYSLAGYLIQIKTEVEDYAGVAELIDLTESLAFMAEPGVKEWVQVQRAENFYLQGQFPAAAEVVATISGSFYTKFAERLKTPDPEAKRVRLPFKFIHQNQNTCAPATLAAIANYWDKPITMEQIVDAICYDGTYDYSERTWCEANGFVTKEFAVTIEATRALIDEGIPFTVGTVDIGSAHAQAVIGYDNLRQTLFIQDPGEPLYKEMPAEEFLQAYQLMGPRGLVAVPQEKAAWLQALELPDEELYDLNYRFNLALSVYDRPKAIEALEKLERLAPDHRLLHLARLSLASFDGNEVERMKCIEALLVLYPEDLRLLYWKTVTLRSLGRREDRIATLKYTSSLSAMHPALLRELGVEWMDNARDWPKAFQCLWAAHRLMPSDAAIVMKLANLLHRSRQETPEVLLNYFRFAASVSDKVEGYAQVWFNYAMTQGKTEDALQWLRRRMKDYGHKSPAPALTLVNVLDILGRSGQMEVMKEAISLRPEDGSLLLQMMNQEVRFGAYAEAEQLLEQARGKVYPSAWLRAKATMLRRQENLLAEQEVWRQIVVLEPLALDAHERIAQDLAATQGLHAAAEYCSTICDQFPHHFLLGKLLVDWLSETESAEALTQIARMVTLHPSDPWPYQKQALLLRSRGKLDEALESAQKSVELAPDRPNTHAILGIIKAAHGWNEQAVQSYRQAIHLDVNYSFAYEALLLCIEGTENKRRELEYIHSEMIRQVLSGEALHVYRQLAYTILEPQELQAQLQEIWQARPDLWEAWSVYITHLLDYEEAPHDQSLQLALQAADQFPLLPGAWTDLAIIHYIRDEKPLAIQSIEKAIQRNPDWAVSWQKLASFQRSMGCADEAEETLRRALRRLPMNSDLLKDLSEILWDTNQRNEAWALIQKVAETDPSQEWAWERLWSWAIPLQRQADVIALARETTVQRGEQARSWLMLARILPRENISEILEALNQAIRLSPQLIDAYDRRAEILAQIGRLDEAEHSIRQSPLAQKEELPHPLLGRLAWLKAQRGDVPGAMKEMQFILKLHRDYYWGWEMLSQWAEHSENVAEWSRAAKEMLRLAPRSPVAICMAADAELRGEDKEKGIEHLKQALHYDPSHAYAANRLLGLYWENRALDDLKKTAQDLPNEGTTGLIKKVYVMLATAASSDHAKLHPMLYELATHPDRANFLASLVIPYFEKAPRATAAVLTEVLKQVIRENSIGPTFAFIWIYQECKKQNWNAWVELARWLPRLGEQLDAAIDHYLVQIGDERAADPYVMKFVERCGLTLRIRSWIWGQVAYALTNSHSFHACIDWLWPDYQRPDAEGWILYNLSQSLRYTKQHDRAAIVSLHVVEEGIKDNSWLGHVGIAVLGLANAGDFQKARALLDKEPLENGDFQPRIMAMIARALCDVMPRPAAEGRPLFKKFLTTIKPLLSNAQPSVELMRDYEAAVQKMKLHTGAMIMPWHKAKPKAVPQNEGDSLWLKFAIPITIIVCLNFIRHCNSGTSYSPSTPRWDPSEVNRLLNETKSLSPQQPLSPYLEPAPRSNFNFDPAPRYETPPTIRLE